MEIKLMSYRLHRFLLFLYQITFGERKANPLSDYRKPFVCTCPTGNMDSINLSTKPVAKTVEDIGFSDLCEKSLLKHDESPS
ncbi:hypothetical protein ACE6H2_000219 [Prunus campanulata]